MKTLRIAFFHPNAWLGLLGRTLEGMGYAVEFNGASKHVDVVVSNSVSTPAAAAAARRYGKPLVEICLDVPVYRMLDRRFRRYYRNYRRRLAEADLVLSMSRKTQEDLLNVFGILSRVLYLYIDRVRLDIEGVQRRRDQVVQISRFVPHKNFEDTIRAAAMLPSRPRLVFIGKSGDPAGLQTLARGLGVDLEIMLDAPDETVARKLRESAVLVSPSSFEGFGLTPLEALYCGTPVVLSDISTFREIYHGVALFHGLRDPRDQAARIAEVLDDPSVGSRMCEAASALLDRFTVERSAECLARHLERVAR